MLDLAYLVGEFCDNQAVHPLRVDSGKQALGKARSWLSATDQTRIEILPNTPGAVTHPSRIKGEEIHFKSGTDSIPGYLEQPAQPGSYPGIVVIHEAFGLVDHIRDIARRFANIGYNALAPDLYARAGGPKDPNDINTVMPAVFALPDAQAVQDLEAAATHLRGLPGATARIGAPSASAQVDATHCCSRAAAAWSMLRSIAGAASSSRDARCRDLGRTTDTAARSGKKPALPAVRGVR
jgi:hypothetical protein